MKIIKMLALVLMFTACSTTGLTTGLAGIAIEKIVEDKNKEK